MSQADMFYILYTVFEESPALNTLKPPCPPLALVHCPSFASHALGPSLPSAPKQFCAFAKELGQAVTANAGIVPI